MTTTAGGLRYGRPVELKASGDAWTVEGYVSTYDQDLVGDVVLPGAYRRTLSDGHPVRFLYAHQPDQVLGTPLSLEEDGRGLYGRFRISKTRLGEDVRTLLLDKALDSFSIGFLPKDAEVDPRTGLRQLKEIELIECSVVAMPANPQAVVTQAKWASPSRSLVVEALERYVDRLRRKDFVRGLSLAEERAYVHLLRARLAARTTAGGR